MDCIFEKQWYSNNSISIKRHMSENAEQKIFVGALKMKSGNLKIKG